MKTIQQILHNKDLSNEGDIEEAMMEFGQQCFEAARETEISMGIGGIMELRYSKKYPTYEHYKTELDKGI